MRLCCRVCGADAGEGLLRPDSFLDGEGRRCPYPTLCCPRCGGEDLGPGEDCPLCGELMEAGSGLCPRCGQALRRRFAAFLGELDEAELNTLEEWTEGVGLRPFLPKEEE